MKRKEVTPLEMFLLIRKGAAVKLQIFLHRIGQRKQVFITKAYWQGLIYYCYHSRPFPLMVDRRGRIISDQMAASFQNKPPVDHL